MVVKEKRTAGKVPHQVDLVYIFIAGKYKRETDGKIGRNDWIPNYNQPFDWHTLKAVSRWRQVSL